MIDTTKLPQVAPEFDIQTLFDAGCHFGHQSRSWHPKMAEWIYTTKDDVHIFDLVKTAQQLAAAYNYAYQLGQEGKSLVFVGTKRQAKEIVKTAATNAGAHYIVSRWLGGLLTNFDQVRLSLKRMLDIESGLKTGKFDGYTKYERLKLEKEVERLGRFFGGLRELKAAPDALFIVDPHREDVATNEAIGMDVPMIALVDSNTDPRPIDLVIPGNDDAVKSIKLIVEAVAAGYAAGKKNRK